MLRREVHVVSRKTGLKLVVGTLLLIALLVALAARFVDTPSRLDQAIWVWQ